jgi:WD40 repeat protein
MSLLDLMQRKKLEMAQRHTEDSPEQPAKQQVKQRHPLSGIERENRFAYLSGIAMGALADGPINEDERRVLRDLTLALDLTKNDGERAVSSAQTVDDALLSLFLKSVRDIDVKVFFLFDLQRMIEADAPVGKEEDEIRSLFTDMIEAEESVRALQSENFGGAEGYADVQYALGLLYEREYGAEQHEAKAARYLKKAAGQGHAQAQYWLGVFYEEGFGVHQDQATAVNWYRKAAGQGSADARFRLASILGETEYEQSVIWCYEAARAGHRQARYGLLRPFRTFSAHKERRRITSAVFSPDGRFILTASEDMTAKLWDAESACEIRTFSGHSESVNSAVFSPDGKRALTASNDKTVGLWDAETGETLRILQGHRYSVDSAVFSSDGERILSHSTDPILWNARTGEKIRRFEPKTRIKSAVFSPDDRFILTSDLYDVTLWDAETGSAIRTFAEHKQIVDTAIFSPDGKRILTCSDDTVFLWDRESGEDILSFRAPMGSSMRRLLFSPDERTLFGIDGEIFAFDTSTWERCPAFSKDYTCSNEHCVLRGETLSFSPDGKTLLTSSSNEVKLWRSLVDLQ